MPAIGREIVLNTEKKFRFAALLIVFCALGFLHGCGAENNSPEEEVGKFVAAGEKAAEERNLGAVKKLISEKYSDEKGREKIDIVRVAAGYFLRNKNIHLFSRMGSLEFPGTEKAELQVYVAMAGLPVESADMFLEARADLYRFDMVLTREDGEWVLSSVQWRPARKDDFLNNESGLD